MSFAMDSSLRIYLVVFIAVTANFLLSSVTARSLQKRAAFYIANETACVVDNIVYYNGDPIPTDDPCESCKCRPPGFACVLRECEVKPGCRAVRRAGHCCPEYICGCEHDGRMYRDGDEIRDAQNPCYTCYCQGSAIACSFTDCFFRVDCTPEYIQGECCPVYNHCPNIGTVQNRTFSQDQGTTSGATIFTTSEGPKEISTETQSTSNDVVSTESIDEPNEPRQDEKDTGEEKNQESEGSTIPPNSEVITTQGEDITTDDIKSTVSPSLLYAPEDDNKDENSSEDDSSEEKVEDIVPGSTTPEDSQDESYPQSEKPMDETHKEGTHYSGSITDDSKDESSPSTIQDNTTLVPDEDHGVSTLPSQLFKNNDEALEIEKSELHKEESFVTDLATTTTQVPEPSKVTPLPILFHNAESAAIQSIDEKKSMELIDESIENTKEDIASPENDSKETLGEQQESSTPQEANTDDQSENFEKQESSKLLNSNTEVNTTDNDDEHVSSEQPDKLTTIVEDFKDTQDDTVDEENPRVGKLNEQPITTMKSKLTTETEMITAKEAVISTTVKVPEFTEKAPVYSDAEIKLKETSTTESSMPTEKLQPTTLEIIESTTSKGETTTEVIDKTTVSN